MATGTVKRFNAGRGDSSPPTEAAMSCFDHHDAIVGEGFTSPDENARVQLDPERRAM
jgi:cold shock CspA family protein